MTSLFKKFHSKTPNITDAKGEIKPNSISSLEKITLGGINQWILIRGHDKKNPILLILHGGPGSIEGPFAYKFESELEKYFIVVNWDQRGAGKSFSKKIPKDSMNVNQFIADAIELINLLKARFNQDKVYLVGHSWGSMIGILLAHHNPELIHAYIGVGQLVDLDENERLSYQFVYTQAEKLGNKKALKQLKKIQPYDGKNIKSLMIQRKWLAKFGGFMFGEKSMWPLIKIGLKSPEYSFKDIFKFYLGVKFSIKAMWPKIFDDNISKQVLELKTPVYFCVGRHDYNTPFELVEKYYLKLKAPIKKLIWFENSAHNPNYEEPEKFNDLLINEILPVTLKKK